MKNFKKSSMIIFVLLVFIISSFILTSIISNDLSQANEQISNENSSKLTKTLANKLPTFSQDEIVKVSIITEDIQNTKILDKASQKLFGKPYDNLSDEIFSFSSDNDSSFGEFVKLKKDFYKNAYISHNSEILKDLNFIDQSHFVSKFSPFQTLSIKTKNIDLLAENPHVLSIDLLQDIDGGTALNVGMPLTATDFTKNSMDLRGDNVKIGLLEFEGYPDKHKVPSLANTKIIYDYDEDQEMINSTHSDPDRHNMHASIIGSMLAGRNGILPNATLYAASVTNGSSFYRKVEWLIEQDVDFINFSGYINSFLDGEYNNTSKWIDHISHQYYVPYINAAGNFGSRPMPSSSMAYNAIVVGAVNTGDSTNHDNNAIYSFSSRNHASETALKPDISAPGHVELENDISGMGTSASAPYVSGTVGQMIDYEPKIRDYPEAIKAILAASSFRRTAKDYGTYSSIPTYSNKEGAGFLDARDAINWILRNNRFLATRINFSRNYVRTIDVNRNEAYRVALAWNKEVSTSKISSGDISNHNTLVDLDLYILDEDRNIVASSISSHNNLELVRFRAQSTGTYTIVVHPYETHGQTSGWIGLAWW